MNDTVLLETIVKELVLYPKEVLVNRLVDTRGVLLTLKVNPADMPTVIGKEGKLAKALRSVLRTYGSKTNAHISLKIES